MAPDGIERLADWNRFMLHWVVSTTDILLALATYALIGLFFEYAINHQLQRVSAVCETDKETEDA